ncbi:MAG TPA: winged helix-turn-helix transcriptional regulator [Anaerolineales bacterium]|nr:winged helix-turn-helix transcriptional regulator [Anaerolineales bacterium]
MNDYEQSKSTRERVLETMLANQRCTINELAEAVEINPISVRHHIARLEAEGLVTSEEERHGVGRPRRVYFLTELGLEQFPTRYVRLTIRLLEQLKETLPPPMIKELFSQMGADVAADVQKQTSSLSMEERLDFLVVLLAKEGFTVEWEKRDEAYHIHESNCPYFRVGQNHPEVCTVDQTLISSVLSVPAEKVRCMLNGDNLCTYVVSKNPSTENVKA